MMKSVVLSIAAAWTVPIPSAPVPATQNAPAFDAPAFRGARAPVVAYAVPQRFEAAQPAGRASGPAEMPATRALGAVAVGVLLGVGLAQKKAALAVEAEDMWWGDKDYPPSRVLGIGRKVGSKFYGITSGLAFGVGCYCIAQSNLLNILSGSTVNGWYVAGALLVPYSWGLHVASWIQKQNENAGTFGK